MSDERALFDAFSRAATDHDRDAVIGAAVNIIANACRQSHKTLGAANEELDDKVKLAKAIMAKNHYYSDGTRREQRIVLPPLGGFLPQLN